MIDKNPQALALAFKKCKGKIVKIKELEINSETDDDAVEALIEKLAEAKFAEEGNTLTLAEQIKRQRWYVEGLVVFSKLKPAEQLDAEYQDAFANSASEAEMLETLTALAA